MRRLTPSKSGDYFVLVGPYDAAFTARLKAAVPPSHRQWRPVSKLWRIWAPHDATVAALIEGEAS